MLMENEVLFSKIRVNLVIVFEICHPPPHNNRYPFHQRSHRSVHSVSGEDDFLLNLSTKMSYKSVNIGER